MPDQRENEFGQAETTAVHWMIVDFMWGGGGEPLPEIFSGEKYFLSASRIIGPSGTSL